MFVPGSKLADNSPSRLAVPPRRPVPPRRIGFRAAPHLLQVRLFKSAADAFWGPTKNVLSGLHGRTWLAPLVKLCPLLVFCTPVVAIVVGAWENHPAVLLAGFAAYVAPYATLWPSRRLFRFHLLKALFFPW